MSLREMTPMQAFKRDIAAQDRNSIMERMAESLHDESAKHDDIYIFERDRIDAINVRGWGYVTYQGREYSFIAESGNISGFLLEDWEGSKVFEPLPPTVWKLVLLKDPESTFEARAFFKMMDNPPAKVGKIIDHYTYDRFVQPGMAVETYWQEQAALHGLKIVCADEANDAYAFYRKVATGDIINLKAAFG